VPAAAQPPALAHARGAPQADAAAEAGPRQLFWLLAFGTGARTEAMLDLEWDRVDLVRRTIDYRVPGVVYKNKRRAVRPHQ
jgi:integrase